MDLLSLLDDDGVTADPEQEVLVLDATTTGFSHIKVSSARASADLGDELAPSEDQTRGENPGTGEHSITGCPGNPFVDLQKDFQMAVALSLADRDGRQAEVLDHERQLGAALTQLESGARLDRDTPKDGHCLFHALVRGGMIREQDIPCKLTVSELRRMALTMAKPFEIAIAGVGIY